VRRITTTFDNPMHMRNLGTRQTKWEKGRRVEKERKRRTGRRKSSPVPAGPDVVKLLALSLPWYEARSASAALRPSLGLVSPLEGWPTSQN
jgi:hypothetical protein